MEGPLDLGDRFGSLAEEAEERGHWSKAAEAHAKAAGKLDLHC